MLARFPVVPFDLFAGRVHASLLATLASSGISVGKRDRRSFPRIIGLKVELS